jgi:hypothetical protein
MPDAADGYGDVEVTVTERIPIVIRGAARLLDGQFSEVGNRVHGNSFTMRSSGSISDSAINGERHS